MAIPIGPAANPDLEGARRDFALGNRQAALAVLDSVLSKSSGDPVLLERIARMEAQHGEWVRAEAHYADAHRLDPSNAQLALNHAVVLIRLGRPGAALMSLAGAHKSLKASPRYWAVRASAERADGFLADAGRSYDRCLEIAPSHLTARHGRARIALERGEADAAARYRALVEATSKSDPILLLGLAEALFSDGCLLEAGNVARMLLEADPENIDAAELLAQIVHSSGASVQIDEHYHRAAGVSGRGVDFYLSWIKVLSGAGRHEDALEVAALARTRHPLSPKLMTAEAAQARAVGTPDKALAVLRHCPGEDPEANIERAGALIELRQFVAASEALDAAMTFLPWNCQAWALRGILWRACGDERQKWLNDPAVFVQRVPLELDVAELHELTCVLEGVHRRAPVPLGQSVRGGTQTRGGLLNRREPILAKLRDALTQALTEYSRRLPVRDDRHPILRFRECQFTVVGSWSVQLKPTHHHVPHIHTNGLVSSAAHLSLPKGSGGLLEIGRPPENLGIDQEPLATFAPEAGTIVLFPSFLYHGTTPFSEGSRLSVAIDAMPAADSTPP